MHKRLPVLRAEFRARRLVVARLPADLALLTAISAAIPYPSMALAAADLALTRRILDLAPPGEPGCAPAG